MSAIARHENGVLQRVDQLTARCRAGDVEAFGQVYAECERHVFRYAYHLLGSADDADDVKQETFVRAWQSLRSFKGECSMLAWLLRICTNLCRDHARRRQRHPESPVDPAIVAIGLHSAEGDPQGMAERRETCSALRKALAALPVHHRQILVLRELEEMRYDEIAEVIGCSAASVKIRLFRARRMLKTRLEALLEIG